jgi:AcrR family transcriptional regulator
LPTPAKTSRDALVAIARRLVESAGADAVTVSAVAQEAGVKGPSLYKHFADRGALLKAVEINVLGELEAVLRAGTKGRTAKQRLRAMAATYRRFAKKNPRPRSRCSRSWSAPASTPSASCRCRGR